MLHSLVIVPFLWLVVVVSISNAEEFETPDEISEIPIGLKTAFARQSMEISDLLHMFITLIKKADKEEGRELGLPEITTTAPLNLESASLEELFDRFETAAQSFRARFLKYLKTTETPASSVEPTISTVFQLNKGEDVTKYVTKQENIAKVGSVPDSERETEYNASTVDPNDSDSSSERTTLAFILPNAEDLDLEIENDYSISTIVPGVDDSDLPSKETTLAFILSNEDPEMETEYSVSKAVSDSSESDFSSDKATLEFMLSNEEGPSLDTESSALVEKTSDKDVTLELVPITERNSEAFIDKSSFESSLDEDFETLAKQFVTEVTLDPEDSALNGKSMFKTTSGKFLNGAATLIFESTTEDGDSEIEAETLFLTDSTQEATMSPFTITNDSSEKYTFVPLPVTEDDDSDKESVEVLLTTEDDSDEESVEVLSTTEDDSDEESVEVLSTTEDDSDEESVEVLSTTEDDSGEESVEALSTTEDDSDEESVEVHSTTDDDESDEVETSKLMMNKSTIKEVDKLVKMLRKASEKYYIEESYPRPKHDEISNSEEFSVSESLKQDLKHLSGSTKQIPNVPEPSLEYAKELTSPTNRKKAVSEDVSSNASVLELNSQDVNSREGYSDRIKLMQTRSVHSHLDVVGVPGENYPNFTNIPRTSFTCEGKESPGLYADLETRCQVFHACWPLRIESYLCPVGTAFNQQILSCDHWYNSTCSLSPDYYEVNLRLRDYPAKVEEGLYEYFDERDLYPYNFRSDHSHLIFNEMKFLPFMYKIVNYSTKRRGIESGSEIDYNKTVEIEFDKNPTLPTLEDLAQQATAADSVDSAKDRFRELLRAFVASAVTKTAESSDEDSSLQKMKLQERKYVYEKMSRSKLDRSGILPDETTSESLNAETTSPNSSENLGVLSHPKNGKEKIAPEILFKVLETAENVVNKGILPMTRDMLAASYIKLYKRKKL